MHRQQQRFCAASATIGFSDRTAARQRCMTTVQQQHLLNICGICNTRVAIASNLSCSSTYAAAPASALSATSIPSAASVLQHLQHSNIHCSVYTISNIGSSASAASPTTSANAAAPWQVPENQSLGSPKHFLAGIFLTPASQQPQSLPPGDSISLNSNCSNSLGRRPQQQRFNFQRQLKC